MVKLKNYNVALTRFVLFLTFCCALSCGHKIQSVQRIEGKEIVLLKEFPELDATAKFIAPYREQLNAKMNEVLAYAPQTLDKSGKWQSAIGNLFADVVLQKSDSALTARFNKRVDFCMLNHGGIRAILPNGNVTTRNAFEIMPFENSVVVAEMDAVQIVKMLQYIIDEKKPHPISGISFTISKDLKPQDILINGIALNREKIYYAATNDYLYNGGDRMFFFKESGKKYDLDYKLRDVLLDHFRQADTVIAAQNIRIQDNAQP